MSQRTAIREANQSHACYARFDSPVPRECKGELHACERHCMDALAGPQRSMDSEASAVRTARPTENARAWLGSIDCGRP
jgi:hypothetical protein